MVGVWLYLMMMGCVCVVYLTVCLVASLRKLPLANPVNASACQLSSSFSSVLLFSLSIFELPSLSHAVIFQSVQPPVFTKTSVIYFLPLF